MKTKTTAVLMAASLWGCAHVETEEPAAQIIELDGRNRLVVLVSGVQAHPVAGQGTRVRISKAGEPMHRVLEGADGKVLFAYDLEVKKGATNGAYQFQLKPADQGPTFDSVREVTVQGKEAVRVELMEYPGSERKVEDVFRLLPVDTVPQERHASGFDAHVQMVHSMLRHLFQMN
jgi:hypothetical protein